MYLKTYPFIHPRGRTNKKIIPLSYGVDSFKCPGSNQINGNNMKRQHLLLILLTLATGCRSSRAYRAISGTESKTVPIRYLYRNAFSGIEKEEKYLVTGINQWRHIAHYFDPPVVPPDFSREMAIVIFAGTKSSGGYSLSIDSIICNANTRIYYRITPPDGIATSVLTQPCIVAAAARCDKPVQWIKN